MSDYGYDAAQVGFAASLRRLGLDHVDLYLLHQPVPTHFEDTIGAYKAAETFLADGRARAIGVSNFSAEHLRRLIDRTDVVPAVNQVELHPYFTQPALREAHAELGIVTQAWSPIGGDPRLPARRAATRPAVRLSDPVITELAAKYGKTPAQVVLRWHLEHGFSRDPEVGQGTSHRRELRRLRLRSGGRRGCGDRRAGQGRARRPGPRGR